MAVRRSLSASQPVEFDGLALLQEQTNFLASSSAADINTTSYLKIKLAAQQRRTAQRNYYNHPQAFVFSSSGSRHGDHGMQIASHPVNGATFSTNERPEPGRVGLTRMEVSHAENVHPSSRQASREKRRQTSGTAEDLATLDELMRMEVDGGDRSGSTSTEGRRPPGVMAPPPSSLRPGGPRPNSTRGRAEVEHRMEPPMRYTSEAPALHPPVETPLSVAASHPRAVATHPTSLSPSEMAEMEVESSRYAAVAEQRARPVSDRLAQSSRWMEHSDMPAVSSRRGIRKEGERGRPLPLGSSLPNVPHQSFPTALPSFSPAVTASFSPGGPGMVVVERSLGSMPEVLHTSTSSSPSCLLSHPAGGVPSSSSRAPRMGERVQGEPEGVHPLSEALMNVLGRSRSASSTRLEKAKPLSPSPFPPQETENRKEHPSAPAPILVGEASGTRAPLPPPLNGSLLHRAVLPADARIEGQHAIASSSLPGEESSYRRGIDEGESSRLHRSNDHSLDGRHVGKESGTSPLAIPQQMARATRRIDPYRVFRNSEEGQKRTHEDEEEEEFQKNRGWEEKERRERGGPERAVRHHEEDTSSTEPHRPSFSSSSLPLDAVPAVATGAYPHMEEPEVMEVTLVTCEWCGRRFAEERVDRHRIACAKQSKLNAIRQKNLRSAQASQRGRGQPSLYPGVSPAGYEYSPSKDSHIATAAGGTSDWRKQSLKLRGALNGLDLVEDDRVECPYCHRRFAADTAARHVPSCKDRMNKR